MRGSAAVVYKIDINADTYGVIYADLHNGNIHYTDNSLTLFDFDHCAYGWRAYDLAIAFGYPDIIRDAMIKGYETHRKLSAAEYSAMPAFLQLRASGMWEMSGHQRSA